MFRSASALLAAVAFLAAAPSLRAQAPERDTLPPLDPRVEAVVSGGAWVQGAVRGRYRVVVRTEGWEHVRRRAFVEWIREAAAPDDPEGDRVVATRELTPVAEAFALAAPQLQQVGARWRATLRAAPGPDRPYAARVQFWLGPPGSVQLVTKR